MPVYKDADDFFRSAEDWLGRFDARLADTGSWVAGMPMLFLAGLPMSFRSFIWILRTSGMRGLFPMRLPRPFSASAG